MLTLFVLANEDLTLYSGTGHFNNVSPQITLNRLLKCDSVGADSNTTFNNTSVEHAQRLFCL